ncbi:MAG: tRNA (guanosine(46)-N7)-methyltransferase TrmB [Phycisphaerales bacterium]|jgi:tRNA (guanine-N7-)-methyltransferase|nr:tRNA (guanosine(46)-N7)-methyltransferase TrmB [Phycisphaeraceae bacterium]
MSFGLGKDRDLIPEPILLPAEAIPALPDNLLQSPLAGVIDIRAWFPNPAAPLELEIGSGKGTFLLQQASRQPETNFLGIEYAREFCVYAADRIRRANLPNVRMLCLDASEFVHWRVPSASLTALHLYFPDPWPKNRHHRRRMIQDRFLADCQRILIPRGELRVVTDHAPYWAWMREHFDRWTAPAVPAESPSGRPFIEVEFKSPPSARDGEMVGTNFERKYRLNPGSGGGGTDFFATTLVNA